MKKIIFTKYSNERDNHFKIKTSIVKNENNTLIVEKNSLAEEATSHVRNIFKAYNLLSGNYTEDILDINKCELKGESVQFEYLEGETLEKRLDNLLEAKNYKGLFEQIEQYNKVINSVRNVISFEVTEEFTQIFGHVNLTNNLMASSISNIDIIFPNIIINSNWNLIDYEWTFYFPIPINFTLYRAISYYINSSSKRKELENMGLLKLLGITEGEIEQYEKMESNFQNYITGNSLTSWNIYNNIHGKCINVNSLAEVASQHFENEIQIFYDYGNDFNESSSTKLYLEPDSNGKFIFKIYINEKIRKLRIDPNYDCCIISIVKLSGYNKGYYDLEYTTNGSNFNNKTIIFNTIDPQIYIDKIDEHTTFIEAEIIIKKIPSILALYLNDAIHNSQQDIEKKYLIKVKNLEEQIDELNILVEKAENNSDKVYKLESMIKLYREEDLNNKDEIGRLNNSIKEYENNLANMQELQETNDLYRKEDLNNKDEIRRLNNSIKEYENNLANMQELQETNDLYREEDLNNKDEIGRLNNSIKEYENNIISKDNAINEFRESFCWKITRPIRIVGDTLRKIFNKKNWIDLFKRVYRSIPIKQGIKNGIKSDLKHYVKNNDTNNISNGKLVLTDFNINLDSKFYDVYVSIVIPTYNGEIYMSQLFETLKRQCGIKSIEIVIVDSESVDNTVKICEEYNVNLIRISQNEFSHSFARNLGASNAHGDYIIFMTQDALPTNEYWVYNMLTPIIKHEVVAVSCWEQTRENCELAYRIDSENFAEYLGIFNSDRIGSLPSVETYESLRKNGQLNDVSCAIVKSVFNKFKYFGDFAEDLDLGVRLIKAGYNIALISSERVIHSHNRSCGYYLKRATVDGNTLRRMFPDFPTSQQTRDAILNGTIFAYYKITSLLDYLYDNVMVVQTPNDFFDIIRNYWKTMSSEISVSIEKIQYGKKYSDEIADDYIRKIVLINEGEYAQEIYILNHMVYYIDEVINKFVDNHYNVVNKKLRDQIIDTIFKRLVITSGNELSLYVASHPQDSKLKNLVDELQRGV